MKNKKIYILVVIALTHLDPLLPPLKVPARTGGRDRYRPRWEPTV